MWCVYQTTPTLHLRNKHNNGLVHVVLFRRKLIKKGTRRICVFLKKWSTQLVPWNVFLKGHICFVKHIRWLYYVFMAYMYLHVNSYHKKLYAFFKTQFYFAVLTRSFRLSPIWNFNALNVWLTVRKNVCDRVVRKYIITRSVLCSVSF
jgi:hypothetical protein